MVVAILVIVIMMVVVRMIEMVGDSGPDMVLMVDLVMILVSTSSDSGRVMKAIVVGDCGGSGSSSDNRCRVLLLQTGGSLNSRRTVRYVF